MKKKTHQYKKNTFFDYRKLCLQEIFFTYLNKLIKLTFSAYDIKICL